MDFWGKGKYEELSADTGSALYQALALNDLPAAWLLAKPLLERANFERLPAATDFNCGLCLYRLEEYEKALDCLKRAELLLGTPPDLDAGEKELFLRAVQADGQVFLRPLNPKAGRKLERYFLVRARWLSALCLHRLGRRQEAVPAVRFLAQYQILVNHIS